MKILLWLPGPLTHAIGGIESFSRTLAQGLRERQHIVYIIAFHLSYDDTVISNHGIHCYHFPSAHITSPAEQLKVCKKIYTLIQTIQPDLYHMQYTINVNLIYHQLLSKYLNMPFILTTHGLLCDESHTQYQHLVTQADHITCVSQYLYQQACMLTGQSHKITCIYHGLSLQHRPTTLCRFNPPRFLCLGRFTHEKGYDIALHAFALFVKQYPQSKLILIGDGVERNALKTLAKHLHLSEHLEWHGACSQDHTFKVLNTVSAVLIPSRYESFGLVAIEAGLCGRPVIASHVGGLPEIIKHEITGYLCPPENIYEFYNAMCRLYHHPDKARCMGEAAIKHIVSEFSADRMITDYISLYAQLLSSKVSYADNLPRTLLAQ